MHLNWVLVGAIPDDATESVATHSSRLQPSAICMPQLQAWCLAALVPKLMRLYFPFDLTGDVRMIAVTWTGDLPI